jgi:hypothetical protein
MIYTFRPRRESTPNDSDREAAESKLVPGLQEILFLASPWSQDRVMRLTVPDHLILGDCQGDGQAASDICVPLPG